jgi:hypothetical protein
LVRAWSAAGLLIGSIWGVSARAGEPADPVPGPDTSSETVEILQARKAGDLAVTVRGNGEDRVRFKIKNNSNRRLNVVLPPGLVAASSAGQGAAGGGFQSMGLGTPTSVSGRFGQYQSTQPLADGGFRSLATAAKAPESIAVGAGQSAELTLPSVCLNFGIPTPTSQDFFHLMDVNDYSPDPRVRKALRSLAVLGTSQGVAQAVMWNVCNGLSFDQMGTLAAKYVNPQEIAVASRFVEALDGSGSSELVQPVHLTQARIMVRVMGDGLLAKDAYRLNSELQGRTVMGLPLQVVDSNEAAPEKTGSIYLGVSLLSSSPGASRARVGVKYLPYAGSWTVVGQGTLKVDKAVSDLDGGTLIREIDHTLAATFVTAFPARRSPGMTTFRIANRLPFTVANVVLRTGKAESAPVELNGLGIGPARSSFVAVPAANASVDRIELNGL